MHWLIIHYNDIFQMLISSNRYLASASGSDQASSGVDCEMATRWFYSRGDEYRQYGD